MDSTVMESRQLSKTLISYLKKIKNISYLWDSRFKNKYDIHLYKGCKQRLDPLIEAVRKPIIQKFFHEPDYNEDYILFPLHFQPEASTCVYARKYENQLYFIEQLTKSIPVGKILYDLMAENMLLACSISKIKNKWIGFEGWLSS